MQLRYVCITLLGLVALLGCAAPQTPAADSAPSPSTAPSDPAASDPAASDPAAPDPAASPSADAEASIPPGLLGVEWHLIEYGPVDQPTPAASTPATITFGDDGRFGGTTGCNSYGGSYTATADAINFSRAISTLIACADESITQQEQTLLGTLDGPLNYELTADQLRVLYGDNSALVFTGEAAPGETATAAIGGVVTGTVTYRQRIALPPDAVVTVQLQDTSLADAPAVTLAEQTITSPGQVPIPFELAYEPAQIDQRMNYTVRAEIRSGDQLIWTTTTAYPVITRGNPTTVELVLEQVSGG